MIHADKIYLCTKTFTLETAPGANRPQAVNWVAGVGAEVVDINPPLKLEGRVEQYLMYGLKAQTEMLAVEVAKSYILYPNVPRTEWLMTRRKCATFTKYE